MPYGNLETGPYRSCFYFKAYLLQNVFEFLEKNSLTAHNELILVTLKDGLRCLVLKNVFL